MYTEPPMSPKVEELLAQALMLSDRDQTELASRLLAALDGPEDADARQAWAREIRRRAERAISGDSESFDWDSVRDEALRRTRAK
jgi:hypothetical protein